MCLPSIDMLLWEAELREAELDRLIQSEKRLTKKLEIIQRIIGLNITDDLKISLLSANLFVEPIHEVSNP